MFIEVFRRYLADRGKSALRCVDLTAAKDAEKAAAVIKMQIDRGLPVPYLMLRHQNPEYKDFVWHWFLCYGYEETEHSFRIDVATYGESAVLDLADLWNTGCEEKGGLILFERRDQKE